MSLPNVDLYLDSGLIPSLSDGNGTLGHLALMGRPILPHASTQPKHTRKPSKPLTIPPARSADHDHGGSKTKADRTREEDDETTPRARTRSEKKTRTGSERGNQGTGSMSRLLAPRPPVIRRTSSLDGRTRGKAPPVSEAKGQPLLKAPRNRNIPHPIPSAASSLEPGQLLVPSMSTSPVKAKAPPKSTSRHLSPPPETARHARSSSWSAPLTARQSSIPLGAASSGHNSNHVKLLTELHRLIPPSRLDPLAPPPSSSALHPPTLLSGLAFILEALVSERKILSLPAGTKSTPLPLLRDRTSLQSTSRELDWSATRQYLVAFGKVLESLVAVLMGTEISEATLGLVEMIKTYIDKMRKVFGEVAGMYMEGYSFVAGWWDEEGMRGSAKEVGRWGEMIKR